MAEIDSEKLKQNLAIGKFAEFVTKYLYDTPWSKIAELGGVSEILDQEKHMRVKRAQTWHDDDYAEAISKFLRDIFESDRAIGLGFIKRIVDQEQLSPDAQTELSTILASLEGDSRFGTMLPVFDDFVKLTYIPDDFYKKLIDEINLLYKCRLTMSLSIMIRKLLENLIIDILRKKYGDKPPGLNLYYNTTMHRFNSFSVLLSSLDDKKEDFHHITREIDNAIKIINKYRETGNKGAHSIDANLTLDDISRDRDEVIYLIQLLLMILQKIR